MSEQPRQPRYDGTESTPCVAAHFTIAGPAGQLEAVSECPPDHAPMQAVAVICHPHTQHGGTLSNKVVDYLARACRDRGAGTVRFNFRGAGRSEGEYDGGDGEVADLGAVLRCVQRQRPGVPIWLAGFSFGAYVALRAASQWPLARLITLAPPVEQFGLGSARVGDAYWILLQGEDDRIVSAHAIRAWLGKLDRKPDATVFLDGVGHFYHGRLGTLHQTLLDQLETAQAALR